MVLLLPLLAAAATSMRAPSLIASHFAHRTRPPLQRHDDVPATEEDWTSEEDWALVDTIPDFTVGNGNTAATFWTALAASSAVLCQRSSIECAGRAALLKTQQKSTFSYGQEPEVLDLWQRLPDGRVTGRLDSARTVWLTVEAEGRLASDPRTGPGYIETLGGRVYELGEPVARSSASSIEATGGRGDELERWSVPKGEALPPAEGRSPLQELVAAALVPFGRAPMGGEALKLLFSFVLVGGLCFELGASSGVLSEADRTAPPAPPPTTVRAYPAAEKVSLTLSEQKARQALRVSADQTRLDALRSEARSYEPGGIKSYDTRLAVLKKRLVLDQERVGVDPERIARDQDAVDNFGPRMQREVDAVRRAIANLELKLSQDQEGLVELTRVEAERGPGAMAVQLGVFPTSAVDPVTAGTIPSVRIPSR